MFPSTRSPRHPIHTQALSHALRKCGFLSTEVTPRGFRATACTLLNELGWNADAIERQLAHGASDDMRRVYNYAQYLPAQIIRPGLHHEPPRLGRCRMRLREVCRSRSISQHSVSAMSSCWMRVIFKVAHQVAVKR